MLELNDEIMEIMWQGISFVFIEVINLFNLTILMFGMIFLIVMYFVLSKMSRGWKNILLQLILFSVLVLSFVF